MQVYNDSCESQHKNIGQGLLSEPFNESPQTLKKVESVSSDAKMIQPIKIESNNGDKQVDFSSSVTPTQGPNRDIYLSFDQNAVDYEKQNQMMNFDIPQNQIASSPEPSPMKRSPLKSTGTRRKKNKENGQKSVMPSLSYQNLDQKPNLVRRPRGQRSNSRSKGVTLENTIEKSQKSEVTMTDVLKLIKLNDQN